MALLTEVNGCYSAVFCVATCQSICVLKQVGKRASQEQDSSCVFLKDVTDFKDVTEILGRKML